MKQIFLIFVLLLTCGQSLLGTTYHIKKNGNNTTGTGSDAAPWLTIQKGVTNATVAGDIVEVHAGTYVEQVTGWPNFGTPASPVIVRAHTGDVVNWESPFSGGGTDTARIHGQIYMQKVGNIQVEGFVIRNNSTRSAIRIENCGTAGCDGTLQASSPRYNIKFLNNIFSGNGMTTQESYVFDVQDMGFATTGNGNGLVLQTNLFTGNRGYSVLIGGTYDILFDGDEVTNQMSACSPGNGAFLSQAYHIGGGSKRGTIQNAHIHGFTVDLPGGTCAGGTNWRSAGIRLDVGASDYVFQDNHIHDIDWPNTKSSAHGIYLESGCNNNLVQRNRAYRIYGGARVGSRNTGVAIGNTFKGNSFATNVCGFTLVKAKDTIVKNNIARDSTSSVVSISDCSLDSTSPNVCNAPGVGGGAAGNNVFSYNDWSDPDSNLANYNYSSGVCPSANQTFAQWTSSIGEAAHSITNDPQFVNMTTSPYDLNLGALSPARGAGELGVNMGAYPQDITPIPATIQIATPAGSNVLKVGDTVAINWNITGTLTGNVSVLVSRDGGGTYDETVSAGTPVSNLTIPWAVLAPASANTLVKVTSISNPSVFDVSNPYVIVGRWLKGNGL